MNSRRLYRSHDRQLAGVAGGMADYLDVDPTLVRILWILGGLFSGGLLIIAYVILAFVIPQAPFAAMPNEGWAVPAGSAVATGTPAWSPDWAARAEAERQARDRSRGRGPGAAAIVGVLLIVFGVIALADSVLPGWIGAAFFGPALVVGLGAALLIGSLRRTDDGGLDVAGAASGTSWAAEAPRPATPAPAAEPVARAVASDDDDTSALDLSFRRPPPDQPDADRR